MIGYLSISRRKNSKIFVIYAKTGKSQCTQRIYSTQLVESLFRITAQISTIYPTPSVYHNFKERKSRTPVVGHLQQTKSNRIIVKANHLCRVHPPQSFKPLPKHHHHHNPSPPPRRSANTKTPTTTLNIHTNSFKEKKNLIPQLAAQSHNEINY